MLNPFYMSVVAPFITRPGHVPRRIEIERKKRLFASQDLESLVKNAGIDYSLPSQSSLISISKAVGLLPVEAFDDEDYEERPMHEWLGLIERDGEGVVAKGVPAKALFGDHHGHEQGVWTNGHVIGWDPVSKKLEIQWEDINLPHSNLPRMHVCFKAEDPFNFARRVAAAHAKRKEAELTLLYNLYVDCMPIDTLPEVDPQQAKRILSMAMGSRTLSSVAGVALEELKSGGAASAPDPAALVGEIRTQMGRALNKIAFDHWLRNHPQHSIVQDLNGFVCPPKPPPPPPKTNGVVVIPPSIPQKLIVARGTLEIPPLNFVENVHSFNFHSFLTKLELIKVIVALRAENIKVQGMNFFSLITKSVRLEEYTNLQNVQTASTSIYLKETWPTNVQNLIRVHLKDLKKGWFNMDETNNEVYMFSKLKKFLTFVNFSMQDTLRFLVEDALSSYTQFLLRAAELHATIINPSKVNLEGNTESCNTPSSFPTTRLPLFVVDLQVDRSGPDVRLDYSSPIDSFLDVPLACFDKALGQIQNIVRVERKVSRSDKVMFPRLHHPLISHVCCYLLDAYQVMKRLFWSFDPVMNTVHPSEEWVAKLRGHVEEALRRSLKSLHEYKAMYEPYLVFLRLDIQEYMKEMEEKYTSGEVLQIEKLRDLVVEHQQAVLEIEQAIPESINLGLFNVACTKISRALIAKHQQLTDLLQDLMARKSIEQANMLMNKYKSIQLRLNKLPGNIEELTELREYIGTIQQQLADLHETMLQSLDNFDDLDSVQFKIDRGAFMLKWEVFGWPKEIMQKVVEVDEELCRRKKEYQVQMEEEQEGFVERLKSLRTVRLWFCMTNRIGCIILLD